MNEYKKDRPTSEQLVDLLDNELEITICADVVHGLDYEYKQLQEENKKLNGAIQTYDILLKANVEENKRLSREVDGWNKKYNDMFDENKQLKIQISAREEEYKKLEDKYKELDKMCELYSKSLYNAELNQYKNNWNKLKEYIDIEWCCFDNESVEFEIAKDILNKMQELEQGSDSNVKD